MRIVHLVKHCRRGNGNVHVAVDLACLQSAKGHHVVYASGGGDFAGLMTDYGVRQSHIIQDRQGFAAMAGSLNDLRRLCKDFKPDIMNAHMMSSAVFGYGVAKLIGIPLLTTVHNSFDGHSILMRLGRKVVAVSQADRRFLLQRGFRENQVVVIRNGPNKSPRESYGKETDVTLSPNSIVTLCGLHQRKGVHDLIRAFSMVQAEFRDWHFYIIGDGPDRQKLEALAESLCSPGSVHFLGSIDRPMMLLRQAAIFVLASLAEPFGLALGEARAAGCAAIATNVGGIPELLEFGTRGQLVEAGHPEQFAAALGPLLKDKAELQKWRDLASCDIEYLSAQRMAEDYDRVYESLI